jgi:RNA polymerase sigma-70 factor (ECF subfamily)
MIKWTKNGLKRKSFPCGSRYSVAVKMLENDDDAEDAVQEAMLRLWEARADNLANPGGYAMQTLKNYCLDRLRAVKETVDAGEASLRPHPRVPALLRR